MPFSSGTQVDTFALLHLQDPRFNITNIYPNGPSTFTVAFSGKAVSPFVWFETPLDGYFSDNGFVFTDILGYNTVNFITPNSTITPAALRASLQVWSMFDVWAGRALPPIPAL